MHGEVRVGNTPTGVGKTTHDHQAVKIIRKHPHRRGEDLRSHEPRRNKVETPPQAWGRLKNPKTDYHKRRNTPTGVGKTEFTR